MPFGWAAVDLFFVLSGYLITGIILRISRFEGLLANFYARRGLRIWPIYYLTVAAIALLGPILPRPRTLARAAVLPDVHAEHPALLVGPSAGIQPVPLAPLDARDRGTILHPLARPGLPGRREAGRPAGACPGGDVGRGAARGYRFLASAGPGRRVRARRHPRGDPGGKAITAAGRPRLARGFGLLAIVSFAYLAIVIVRGDLPTFGRPPRERRSRSWG